MPFQKFAEMTHKEYRIIGYDSCGVIFVADMQDMCFKVHIPKRVMHVIRLFSDGAVCNAIRNSGIADIDKTTILFAIREETKKRVPEANNKLGSWFWKRVLWFKTKNWELVRDLSIPLKTVRKWRRKIAPITEYLIWLDENASKKSCSNSSTKVYNDTVDANRVYRRIMMRKALVLFLMVVRVV